jgi:hypothetical protein
MITGSPRTAVHQMKLINGIEQIPLHGVSFADTFGDARRSALNRAATARERECRRCRADRSPTRGWVAVALEGRAGCHPSKEA